MPTTSDLQEWIAALADMPAAATVEDGIARIRVLEEIKAACAAAQARESVAVETARIDAERAVGVPARDRGRGIGAEIALARRSSPSQGGRHLGLARALTQEMPRTMAALTRGELTEWRATILARETAWLPTEARREVDAQMATRWQGLGDRQLATCARALAQSLDPAAAVEHIRRAPIERRVTVRPAHDGLAYLTALLPMPQAVAAYAGLRRAAAETVATGAAGDRTRDQVMADRVVELTTGQVTAEAVPVEVHLVMTDRALIGADDTSAWLVGHGPIPAPVARELLAPEHDGEPGTRAEQARVWLRRLYTHPDTGHLVAMDSRRRTFSGQLRRMVVLRDDTCRVPWCDAPICDVDHARAHRFGGVTSYANGSGLCTACNQTKELAGWRHDATPDALTVSTPTRHSHTRPTTPLVRGAVDAVADQQGIDDPRLVDLHHPSPLEMRLLRLAS